jgi:hypothetical protein
MKHKIFTLFLLTVLIYANAFTQPFIKAQKAIGGNADDLFSCMALTKDGGLIVGGTSYSGISGEKTDSLRGLGGDYWIVKMNKAGIIEWDKTIGGSGYDYLTAIQQTTDGGYILGGYSSSEISGEKTAAKKGSVDYWIVKLDAMGNIEWDETYGGIDEYYTSFLYAIELTNDGGYIMTGIVIGDDYNSPNLVIKIDSLGNMQWYKRIGGEEQIAKASSIIQTRDGGYFLGSSTYDHTIEQLSYRGVKMDDQGNIKWNKIFAIGAYTSSAVYAVQQTDDGGFLLGGNSDASYDDYPNNGYKTENGRGGADYWLLKVDSIGNYVWDKTIGGSGDDYLRSLTKTKDGGYILGGYSKSNASGEKTENSRGYEDYWVVELDSLGKIQWDKTIGGENEDFLRSIKEIEKNRYALGGTSYSGASGDKTQPSIGGSDYWLVELNYSSCRIRGQKRNLCGGGNFGYSVRVKPKDRDAKYTWSVPEGCTILSGQGTDSIEINIPSNFTHGVISVAGDNGCGTGDTITTKPFTPAEISGPSNVSAGQKGLVYSTTQQPELNYFWIVPADAVIVSGQGTNSVTVNWGSTTGPIIVKAAKCADSSGRRMRVHVINAIAASENLNASGEKTRLSETGNFHVYPNPAQQTASIIFTAKKENKYVIEITDVAGKILERQQGISRLGENKINIDVSKYAKGMYLINLIDKSGKRSLKLNKQ